MYKNGNIAAMLGRQNVLLGAVHMSGSLLELAMAVRVIPNCALQWSLSSGIALSFADSW